MFLGAVTTQAQITIGGNIYGGGNAGDMTGKTSVVIRSADIDGSVFGGARQANVGGSTFVNIDGNHMSGDILINYVYGGNDIAGTIGQSDEVPADLTKATEYGVNEQCNAFVLTTQERMVTTGEGPDAETTQPYKIFIGQLFGGGNGDYDYPESPVDGKYVAKSGDETIATSLTPFVKPETDRVYIEMRGGSCVILYGGGNNVTVREATDICIDNPSTITDNVYERDENGQETTTSKLTDQRLKNMGVYDLSNAGSVDQGVATSPDYQFSRVFGGNNKADMAIRPKWHLEKGKIRNLYSGGNHGAMTHLQKE